MIDTEKVAIAAMVYLLSPCRGTPGYTPKDMMTFAGIDEEFAASKAYEKSFTDEFHQLEQKMCKSVRQTDPKLQLTHFKTLNKYLPHLSIPKILRIMGCSDDELYRKGLNRGGSNLYQNAWNFRDRLKKKQAKEAPTIDPPPPTTTINTTIHSPVSTITEDLPSPEDPILAESDTITLLSLPTKTKTSSSSLTTATTKSTLSKESSHIVHSELPKLLGNSEDIADLKRNAAHEQFFTGKARRKSCDEAQEDRRWQQNIRNIRSISFKVGTILYDSVKNDQNLLKKFHDAAACAEEVNKLFGFSDLVSGDQLLRAVREDRVGKSPLRRGRKGQVPIEDVKDIADLVYTISTIEQNNASKRMTRSELVTFVGSVVNDKLVEEGKQPISNTWQFYNRIQTMNSLKQNVALVDKREARRVLWLTIQNTKQHFIKWEKFLVDKGFARAPSSEREKHHEGHVVFYPGQRDRIIIFDECKVSLDGSSDENAGGRPSITPSTGKVNEAGSPTIKSADAVTLMLGAIGTEMIPPLVIYPSGATSKKNFKFATKNIKSFHQIWAKYGFEKHCWHDAMFAISKKGGMNKEIFENYINEHVLPLIPDVADVRGKRVVMKADMGPGRTCINFLSRSKVVGAYFFPGMPNSTEVMQEMDQVFGAFKSAIYNNRAALFEARMKIKNLLASLSQSDIGYLLFGGTVELLPNGPTVELHNAFANCLSEEHLLKAYRKCGYCPATRAPLKSEKMRFVIQECGLNDDDSDSESESEDLDVSEIATTALLNWLESTNHSTIDKLVSKGYRMAEQGKRFANRVTAEQTAARKAMKTRPGTVERQNALANARYSGDHFYIDGGCMNSADLLIGLERKEMQKQAKKLQTLKNRYVKAEALDKEYRLLIQSQKKKWNAKNYIMAIRRHHGIDVPPKGETSLDSKSAGEVKRIYDRNYKDEPPPPFTPWSERMEEQLSRYLRGEINSLQETQIYATAVMLNEDYLVHRLGAVSERTRLRALRRLSDGIGKEARDRLLKALTDGLNDIEDFSDEEELLQALFRMETANSASVDRGTRKRSNIVDDNPDSNAPGLDTIEEDTNSSVSSMDSAILDDDPESSSVDSDLLESDEESDDADAPKVLEAPKKSPQNSMALAPARSSSRIREKSTKKSESIDSEALVDERMALLSKKAQSSSEEELENALKAVSDNLEEALAKISRGDRLNIKHLKALILSRGSTPPEKALKAKLEQLWKQFESNPEWKRTVYFTEDDKNRLDKIEDLLTF